MPQSDLLASFQVKNMPKGKFDGEERRGITYFSKSQLAKRKLTITTQGLCRKGKPFTSKDIYEPERGLDRKYHDVKKAPMYVLSPGGSVYSNTRTHIGGVKHSSFKHGNPIVCGGKFHVVDGKVIFVDARSGHYKPKFIHLLQALAYFEEQGVLDENCTVDSRLPKGGSRRKIRSAKKLLTKYRHLLKIKSPIPFLADKSYGHFDRGKDVKLTLDTSSSALLVRQDTPELPMELISLVSTPDTMEIPVSTQAQNPSGLPQVAYTEFLKHTGADLGNLAYAKDIADHKKGTINYWSPQQILQHAVTIQNGLLMQNGKLFSTNSNHRHVILLDPQGNLSIPADFDPLDKHSSKDRGKNKFAGECKVVNGQITELTNKSGHYQPGPARLIRMACLMDKSKVMAPNSRIFIEDEVFKGHEITNRVYKTQNNTRAFSLDPSLRDNKLRKKLNLPIRVRIVAKIQKVLREITNMATQLNPFGTTRPQNVLPPVSNQQQRA